MFNKQNKMFKHEEAQKLIKSKFKSGEESELEIELIGIADHAVYRDERMDGPGMETDFALEMFVKAGSKDKLHMVTISDGYVDLFFVGDKQEVYSKIESEIKRLLEI